MSTSATGDEHETGLDPTDSNFGQSRVRKFFLFKCDYSNHFKRSGCDQILQLM